MFCLWTTRLHEDHIWCSGWSIVIPEALVMKKELWCRILSLKALQVEYVDQIRSPRSVSLRNLKTQV